MKLNLTAGCLFLLGLPLTAIEAPGTSTPIPPQPTPGNTSRPVEPAPAVPSARLGAPDRADKQDDNSPFSRFDRQQQDDSDDNADSTGDDSDVIPTPAAPSAYLGIGGSEVPDILAEHLKLPEGQGMVIRTLDPDGPAAKAGLAANDIVTKIDGNNVASHEDLRNIVGGHKPGDDVSIDYIHRGDAKNVHATLEASRNVSTRLGNGSPLDTLRLEGMPPDQARRIRDAVERNLRAFDNVDRGMARQQDAAEEMTRGLQQRLQQMLGAQGSLRLQGGIGSGGNNGMSFKSSSTVRLLDDKGSIELRSEDDSKKVRAFDKDGKLQWEGPYNTDDDKKAMPDEIRDRVDKLSPDMDFKGNGFRLNLGPRR